MDNEENGESNVMCICKQLISKQDWQDHQIVCTKRRYTCPAYVSFISNIKSNEYSLPLVDSNCPPSLKEIAKLQVLQSEKENRLEWLESNLIPPLIIHTLKKECPTFKSKQELINHIENMCPYWKINCPMVKPYKVTTLGNSHKEDNRCLELSRQEFILHLTETKENRLEWLESNLIPPLIIHTLKKECPTFKSKQELINHIENMCPYWKINCPMVKPYKVTTLGNSHKEDNRCLELSRQEFILHLTETALDPISQRIRAISKIFPYHCKTCDQYLLSSGIHICVKARKSININDSEILCPGCKSIIRINSKKTRSQEIENTCVNCHNNEMVVGLPDMIPSEHYEKGIVNWNNGTERTRVKWSLIKNS